MKPHEWRRSARPCAITRGDPGTPTEGQIFASGYAAMFEVESVELAEIDPATREIVRFTETIARGAFASSIGVEDVRCLYNHDDRLIFGRTGNDSLSLEEDDIGLAFRVRILPTSYGNDLLINTDAGLAATCSFGFDERPGGSDWQFRDDGNYHRINDCLLKEISIGVTFPAYPQTSFAMRSARASGRLIARTAPAPAPQVRTTHHRENARLWLDLN